MTDSVTNIMKQKARGAPPPFDPEEFQDLRQQVEELRGIAVSTQALVREVTDMSDFQPPLVVQLRAVERAISETSGSLSKTAVRLDEQAKRIDLLTRAAFREQVAYIRRIAAIVCIACNLPGTVGVFLLAWRAGLL